MKANDSGYRNCQGDREPVLTWVGQARKEVPWVVRKKVTHHRLAIASFTPFSPQHKCLQCYSLMPRQWAGLRSPRVHVSKERQPQEDTALLFPEPVR